VKHCAWVEIRKVVGDLRADHHIKGRDRLFLGLEPCRFEESLKIAQLIVPTQRSILQNAPEGH
jgi:hypothetical protein